MRWPVLSALAVVALCHVSCTHSPGPLRLVMAQFDKTQSPSAISLYICTEIDRSGNDYHKKLHDFDIKTVKDRLAATLSEEDVEVLLETIQADVYSKVRYKNPFSPVEDSSNAQVILRLYVDGFRFSSEFTGGQKLLDSGLTTPHGIGLRMNVFVQGVSTKTHAEIFQFNVDIGSEGKYERNVAMEGLDIATDRIVKVILKP